MRDRSQPSPPPTPAQIAPSLLPRARYAPIVDVVPFDDATLIMRFKTRAHDYMATAERNAYQHSESAR